MFSFVKLCKTGRAANFFNTPSYLGIFLFLNRPEYNVASNPKTSISFATNKCSFIFRHYFLFYTLTPFSLFTFFYLHLSMRQSGLANPILVLFYDGEHISGGFHKSGSVQMRMSSSMWMQLRMRFCLFKNQATSFHLSSYPELSGFVHS